MPQLHSLIVSSDFVYWKLLCASSRARDTHRNGHQAEDKGCDDHLCCQGQSYTESEIPDGQASFPTAVLGIYVFIP